MRSFLQRQRVVLGLLALNLVLLVVGTGLSSHVDPCSDGRFCVGLVFDVGGLGDKSFNDAAHRGLVRATEELGIGFHFVEPGDGSDRESALRELAAEKHDLVIGVGFIFSDDMRKLAGEFPDTRFACIDYSPEEGEETPPNLSGLRFREHEGSFLVGAIAALKSKSKTIGFVGGMNIPLIRKFESGYRAGAKAVCAECNVLATYAGNDSSAFANPGAGKEIATAQMDQGADVVFHAAGTTGLGVFGAVAERQKWAIGVDSDQFHEMPCCMLTSMTKEVDTVVFETVRDTRDGTFISGIREFGLAEKGVDFVLDDNNRDRISPEILERVAELREKIISGQLEVPSE